MILSCIDNCIDDCAVDFGGFRGSNVIRWYCEVVLNWSLYGDWIEVPFCLAFTDDSIDDGVMGFGFPY